MQIVEIREEPIELYKLLKHENLAASGGEAKGMIGDGLVRVNGSVETRKRKKIVAGDIVEVSGRKMQVRKREGKAPFQDSRSDAP